MRVWMLELLEDDCNRSTYKLFKERPTKKQINKFIKKHTDDDFRGLEFTGKYTWDMSGWSVIKIAEKKVH